MVQDEALRLAVILLFCLVLSTLAVKYAEFEDDSRTEFWIKNGQESLKKILGRDLNTNQAKNVIVFIGDGMGIPTITASRIYKGQKTKSGPGEETVLFFEDFPHVALVKTYNVDRQVPDSAATATAIFTGVKTNYETLGLSPSAQTSNCNQSLQWSIDGMLTWAQRSGRSTGIVTTTRITHATPAALYTHIAHRDWENDAAKPANASRCKDIARQLVEDEPGRNLNVILGGGRRSFVNSSMGGKRMDGLDLINLWSGLEGNDTSRRRYVSTAQEMNGVDPDNTDHLLGLFAMDHMDYELDRIKKGADKQPSLKEMTSLAIKILRRNPKGFFLMVEGGRIDHAHHDTNAKRAFEDTVAYEAAIQEAVLLAGSKETLTIVTADHSHVMTMNGYPVRGNDILAIGDVSDADKHPYTTIMYTTGPGHINDSNGYRSELSKIDTSGDNYIQMTLVPMSSETHGGEDVAVYAIGPYAHLFQGVQEQSYIAHAINFAACMGPKEFITKCGIETTSSAVRVHKADTFIAFFLFLFIFSELIKRS